MFGWFKRSKPEVAKPDEAPLVARRESRYDAAQTNDGNRRHWAMAEGLSADAANNAAVRRVLRQRARYEVANNSYGKGMILTLANDVVGTGPRLSLTGFAPDVSKQIRTAFASWCRAIKLPSKLRTLTQSKVTDGEAFALLTTNPGLANKVKLDVRLVEADQFTLPFLPAGALANPASQIVATDGITLDENGNPLTYAMLRYHPGNIGIFTANPLAFDAIPARNVIHWFRVDRAGQHRGVPEITSALSLFALLRRYTLATVKAAEMVAAMGAMTIESQGAADAEETSPPWATLEIDHGTMTTLPYGYKANQLKAEQPTTTYPEFKRELVNEGARCVGMPYNISAGNSSGYNYSSGRLDHQTYFRAIGIEREDLEAVLLERIFRAWLDEAVLVEGLLPQAARALDVAYECSWFWDGMSHVDPEKEANAATARLQSGTTTYQREFAEDGYDWEEEQTNQAAALGVTLDEYRALLRQYLFFGGKPGASTGDQAGAGAQRANSDQEEEVASAA